jgi:hypothetical protein
MGRFLSANRTKGKRRFAALVKQVWHLLNTNALVRGKPLIPHMHCTDKLEIVDILKFLQLLNLFRPEQEQGYG